MTTTPTVWKATERVHLQDQGPRDNDQYRAKFVQLTSGEFAVFWTDNSGAHAGGGGGTDIIFRRFDAQGRGFNYEFQARSSLQNDRNFDVAALPGGGCILVYEIQDIATGSVGLHALKLGLPTPFSANYEYRELAADPGADQPGGLSVAVNADGSFQAAYQQTGPAGWTSFSNIVPGNLTTNLISPIVSGNGAVADFRQQSDSAHLTNGNNVMVFRHHETNQSIVIAIRTPANGIVKSPAYVGNTWNNLRDDTNPAVAALTGGGFVVVWQSRNGAPSDVFFQRYDAAGTEQGGVADAEAGAAADTDFAPAVIGLDDGGFFIAWSDNADQQIQGQRFSAAGAAVGNVVTIATTFTDFGPIGLQLHFPVDVALEKLQDGRIGVTWTEIISSIDDPALPSNSDVRFKILDPRENSLVYGSASQVLTTRLESTTLDAGGGNDTVFGQGGADTIRGGTGDDTISGGLGNDNLDGGAGIDTLDWSAATGAISLLLQASGAGTGPNVAGIGQDTFAGMENVIGGSAGDTIYGNAVANRLSGGAGRDQLRGGGENDRLIGGDETGAGDTFLGGEAGNDTIFGGLGDDRADGGDGNDTLYGSISDLFETSIDGHDYLTGGAGDDYIYGGNEYNAVLLDGPGDAFLGGDAGADRIFGGLGDDRIDGGAGSDPWLSGESGSDYITGGDGDDRIEGGSGPDALYGGAGRDTITDNGPERDIIYGGDETGAGDVFLGGGIGSYRIFGGGGNDRVAGGDESDLWLGGDAGLDVITGGAGDDRVDGGADNDTLYGETGRDTMNGGTGSDTLYGGTEAAQGDSLSGDAGADYIYGGDGDDFISGGADNDRLSGDNGADAIYGEAGADLLFGGAGGDYVEGGTGNDQLTGGTDADRFFFHIGDGVDTVLDFVNDVDTILLGQLYGFASVAAVLARTIQSGSYARILLNASGSESIYLAGFLTPGNGNTIASLGDDILLV